MVISILNDANYSSYRHSILSGKVTGIWNNVLFMGTSSYPIFPYNYLTSEFSSFEKNIYKNNVPKIVYHLSGYGSLFNESYISFLGESTERYSYVLSKILLKSNIIKGSYKELKSKYLNDYILPLKYINIQFEKNSVNYLNADDKIKWVCMNSLINPGKKVWIPLQFVLLADNETFQNEKKYNITAVSTGTACHDNFTAALQNALIEYEQIDSFNLWWYGGIKGTPLKCSMQFIQKLFDNVDTKQFSSNFKIRFTDISFDKDIYVIVCEIFANEGDDNLPKYTVGVQGGLTKSKCVYRSFMEALTVLEYSMNVAWLEPKKYIASTTRKQIGNLDDNVLKYAIEGKPKLKLNNFSFTTRKKSKTLKQQLENLSSLSKYAACLDISPLEFKNLGFTIVRVIVPELLPVSMPTYPPKYHPKYKKIGGIKNTNVHPMA
ncbi:YcaO-like family protein [Limosilactobacillus walteri]|uniref:YcaO-like family protein n=1 Tax=Limosilactobacillus walteri TaxID=2268022 RepID=UPI001CD82C2D|nr:YcaO-like family protein [Limosilactobacillus walteri]